MRSDLCLAECEGGYCTLHRWPHRKGMHEACQHGQTAHSTQLRSAHTHRIHQLNRIYTISRHVHTEMTGAAGQSNFHSPGIVWHDATHSAKSFHFRHPTVRRATCVLSAVEICGHRTGVEILPSRKVGSLYFRLPTSDFQLPTYRYTDANSHMANEREREPLQTN